MGQLLSLGCYYFEQDNKTVECNDTLLTIVKSCQLRYKIEIQTMIVGENKGENKGENRDENKDENKLKNMQSNKFET